MQIAEPAPHLGEGQQEVRPGVPVGGAVQQLGCQPRQQHRLGVLQPAQADEHTAERVQPADAEGLAEVGRARLQLLRDGQGLVEAAQQRLDVGPVVEDHQLAPGVTALVGQREHVGVAEGGRGVPVLPQGVGQPQGVVDAQLGGRVVVEQVDGLDRVLQRGGGVAQLLEDRGEHVGAARPEEGPFVLDRPAADRLSAPAGLGVLAPAPRHVRADEPGAQPHLGQLRPLGLGRDPLGPLGDALDGEAREGLQLGNLGGQPPERVVARVRKPCVDDGEREHASTFGRTGGEPERAGARPPEGVS
ncbi:hypothetical protein JKP75_09965 [Blastococcus sp. TML/M2B]|uniref:hypothetical protein n=1 Tax=Blastococcus sp. TML/M2B TaxID=2798727 RepID=UPI00190DCE0C|nr:hypothetical protein [Blastococcus sp. TML/M2B]MBN1092854.1 hypothetical protein [Blastococcus sp. TML/M2B]